MASIASSPSKPHHQSSPDCPSTPTDDDSQRGRKRRRSSAAEHVSSNGSTTLRGRGRYRWPSISLSEQQERVRKKSPERKAKKKFFGGGKFVLGLGGRDLKTGQISSPKRGEIGKENQGVVEEECGPKLRRRRSSHEARDRNEMREDQDEDEDAHAGEKNAVEDSEAESSMED